MNAGVSGDRQKLTYGPIVLNNEGVTFIVNSFFDDQGASPVFRATTAVN